MKRLVSFCLAVAVLSVVWLNLDAQVAPTTLAQPLAGWEMITAQEEGAYNGEVVAKCSAGKKILGGGYRLFGGKGVVISVNSPLADQRGWVLAWTGTSVVASAYVTAICAKA